MHATVPGRSVTIKDTEISHNTARMTNTVGSANAVSAGLHPFGDITLIGDEISNNTVIAEALQGSSGDAHGDSGAGEVFGIITGSQLSGNSVIARLAARNATAGGGAAVMDNATVSDSVVDNNTLIAVSPRGTATVTGGGLVVAQGATLQNTSVSGNTGRSRGSGGTASGGGIFDSPIPDGPPGGPLI